ncbi:MAG TPA: protein-glutamate O-methyltransferase [Polyangia bacterium]|nr:protein-glutamate O-methyltransferase [Polyangia bacterium]
MSDALAVVGPLLGPGRPDVKPLEQGEFGLFQRIVHREAGIHLGDIKLALVASRLLRRIRELGLSTYGAYYRRVVEDRSELTLMLDAITTNETQFFREGRHFELLTERLIPAWRDEAARGARDRRVRVWSAGCSTGEEPYSLAMTLLDALPPEEGWDVQILATDLSTRVLEIARTGVYTAEKAAGIPRGHLQTFMLRGVGRQDGNVKVSPALQAAVSFRRLNLNDEAWDVGGPFDAILCRNVFIYFNQTTRNRIVAQLLGHLRPRGHFFVGHSESLGGTPGLETVIPTVYRKEDPRK